jgi:glycosyltransferase involved in cell wall biosynthesis
MKKVLIIGPRAYPSQFEGTSGVETYIEEVVQEMVTQSDQLHLQIFTRKKYQQTVKQYSKIEVTTTALPSLPGKLLEGVSYSVIASLRSCWQSSDVVWYHTAGMASFAWLPYLFGKKVWITVHSADWQRKKWSSGEKFLFFHTFCWVAKHCATEVFAVSEELVKKTTDLVGRSVTLTVAGLPKNVGSITTQKDSHPAEYILYLGRLVPEKRVEWLLEFCSQHRYPVIIAGSHGNMPEYEKKLRETYQDKLITWVGTVSGKNKWQLLQKTKVLVLPSELEGLPIVVLESISTQTPIFLHENILPKELSKISLVTTFTNNDYASFDQALQNTLQRLKKKRPQLSRSELRSLSLYDWTSTSRVYLGVLFSSSEKKRDVALH